MKFIDLRSDTVTTPTEEMRHAMATAIVGDDVYEDDPTIKELEKLSAEATGKAAALFTPSGTMANQLAIMAHTKRGDEIIVGKNSHIVTYEVGGASILSNASYRTINNPDTTISGQDIHGAVRSHNIHHPDTGLVCLENALANGTVVSVEKMKDAYTAAKAYNLPVHLDGARLFNAAVHLNVDPREITNFCDTVMFCLSKGLCAPIGSILCGDKEFITRARKYRKMLGGGMRQVGILAASGIIALEKMTKRLYIDHENARYLAQCLAELPCIDVDMDTVQINIIFFKIVDTNFDHTAFARYLLEKGIKINAADGNVYRFVTHNDISREDIDFVLDAIKTFIS